MKKELMTEMSYLRQRLFLEDVTNVLPQATKETLTIVSDLLLLKLLESATNLLKGSGTEERVFRATILLAIGFCQVSLNLGEIAI
jgi:hypothetical protein